MILVMDAGNTNIIFGIYNNHQLLHNWRIVTERSKTEDEYAMQLKAFFLMRAFHLNKLKELLYPQLCHQLCLLCSGCVKNIFALSR